MSKMTRHELRIPGRWMLWFSMQQFIRVVLSVLILWLYVVVAWIHNFTPSCPCDSICISKVLYFAGADPSSGFPKGQS